MGMQIRTIGSCQFFYLDARKPGDYLMDCCFHHFVAPGTDTLEGRVHLDVNTDADSLGRSTIRIENA